MQDKSAYHQEIERLQEARQYGASRIEQVQEERRFTEDAGAVRRRPDFDDDDDFIDNTGEDMAKTMRKVKMAQDSDNEEEVLPEGAITKSFRNAKVICLLLSQLRQKHRR